VVPQSRRKALEPKLEVIKKISRDSAADCNKTYGTGSVGQQIGGNYVDDNGFEARHSFSSKLGKFGVIEDGGSHDNCFKRRTDLNKLQQTKTDKMDSYVGSQFLQNQPNDGKELDSGKCNLRNQRELRKNNTNCGSGSHVLHYTVCLHGWGNIVLFSDSVAL